MCAAASDVQEGPPDAHGRFAPVPLIAVHRAVWLAVALPIARVRLLGFALQICEALASASPRVRRGQCDSHSELDLVFSEISQRDASDGAAADDAEQHRLQIPARARAGGCLGFGAPCGSRRDCTPSCALLCVDSPRVFFLPNLRDADGWRACLSVIDAEGVQRGEYRRLEGALLRSVPVFVVAAAHPLPCFLRVIATLVPPRPALS
jgi:hypothetical protein